MKLISILKEINGSTGQDIAYSNIYNELFDAKRDHEENSLPMGVWEKAKDPMRWEEIELKCLDLIINKSKDLKLYSLLGESKLILQGITTLKPILSTFKELIQKFKNELYPKELDQKNNIIIYLDHNWQKRIEESLKEETNGELFLQNIEKWSRYFKDEGIDLKSANETLSALIKLIEENLNIIEETNVILNQLKWNLIIKIKESLNNFKNYLKKIFSNLPKEKKAESAKNIQENDDEELEIKIEEEEFNKETAIEKIQEAINILSKSDPQSVIIPMLEKAKTWVNYTFLEIADDLSQCESSFEELIKIIEE
jgi:hypothetical protein